MEIKTFYLSFVNTKRLFMDHVMLIPTDFSEACQNAIDHGIEIAKDTADNICLLHIIDKHTKAWLKKNKLPASHIDEKLSAIADKIKTNHGLLVQTISREGNIFNSIGEIADEINAAMILLGTHGKTGIQKITGSYALKVISNSPVPVIVFHKPKFVKQFKKIVFPVDTSLATKQKLAWAVHIAEKYNSVINIFQIRETSDELNYKLKKLIKQISKSFENKNIEYTVKEAPKEGNFARQVNDFALQIDADLIMIMTNAKEGLPHYILGPWDEKIIFNAGKIPVMCINPHPYDYVVE